MLAKKRKSKLLSFIGLIFILAAITAGFVFFVNLQNVLLFKPKTVKIYFFKDNTLSYVERTLPKNAMPLYFAAEQLLLGPNEAESAKGYYSEIPKGTKIISVYKKGDTIIADFSNELGNYGGGTAKVQSLLAQIVYTFLEQSKAKKVQILVGGKTETILGGEGFLIDKPLTKDDVEARDL